MRLLGVVSLYALAYSLARASNALVHTVSYVSVQEDVQYFHRVEQGDFGPGMLQSPLTRVAVGASAVVFAPLCLGERMVWSVVPYDGEALPDQVPAGTRG